MPGEKSHDTWRDEGNVVTAIQAGDVILVVHTDGTVDFITPANLLKGKQSAWIPVDAMRPATTNGCSEATQVELTAGQAEVTVMDFDGATEEHATFSVKMPKEWDRGTFSYRAEWFSGSATSTTVAWQLAAVAIGDGDALGAAFGTAVVVTDANGGTANQQRTTDESGAVTAAGTPAEGDRVVFDVSRDPDNVSDDMTEDARLIGIELFFDVDNFNSE